MSRDITPFGLRMPPDLKQQIEDAAKANGRSLNAEIVARLQASLEQAPATSDIADIERRLAAVEARLQDGK